MTIDELRGGMIDRFERTETRFDELRDEMMNRFEKVDGRLDTVNSEFAKMRAEMKAEGEATRRHFDIVAEKMSDSVKIVAEATAHHAVRIDDHEKRLKRLERPRRS